MSEKRSGQLLELCRHWREAAPSPAALETARMGIFDVVGCIVGGAPTPTAGKARGLAQDQGVVPEASVLGTSVRLAAPLAAFANGVAGHVLDYDDMSSTFIGHPSVVLVPPLLALGEARRCRGADIVAAYVFGFEVDTFFGRIMSPAHYDAGWHATSSIGVLGATAASARLLGLDAATTLNALAIAASNAAGLRANFGSETKSLHAGQAAEGALRAALLAGRGLSANPADVFDGPLGFFEAYRTNAQPRPDSGKPDIEASGIGIKPYACCGAGVSVIDAAIDLRAGHDFDPMQIERVEVKVSTMATRIMPFRRAADGLQAKYSLNYCAAVALLDAKGGLAQFEDARVNAPDVQALTERTTVVADERMASGAGRFGVEMTVVARDGRRFATELVLPRGHPQRQLPAEALLEKFLECAGPVVGDEAARSAAAGLCRLEQLPDLAPIIVPLTNPSSR